MTELALAYLAGLLTTLSPCVLPMLPLVLAGTLQAGRLGPPAFGLGMIVSFTAAGLFVAGIGASLGLNSHILRSIAGLIAMGAGALLLFAPLQLRFAAVTAGLADGASALASRYEPSGVAGPFLIGVLAGAIWSPCFGPSLGMAIALAAEADGLPEAGLRMLVFGAGAASAMTALAYGSQGVIMARRERMRAMAESLRPVAGTVFLLVGAAVVSGVDKRLEALLVDLSPGWLTALTTRF